MPGNSRNCRGMHKQTCTNRARGQVCSLRGTAVCYGLVSEASMKLPDTVAPERRLLSCWHARFCIQVDRYPHFGEGR